MLRIQAFINVGTIRPEPRYMQKKINFPYYSDHMLLFA